ncbi:uncharacterized protein FIESC28_09961 [Fusarium coffeatum]|uniref:Cytochrome P450 n=1 Tax=Fusarium coffeatum TaxID=231269 RepID=A0A366QWU7_9HYPO|nr:uncharacterized protein FIESC28_09961 [Fusarium coffeatum]RBR09353.1 hypothetical protein FIESC28_09961 [Fusarium coffeatum]
MTASTNTFFGKVLLQRVPEILVTFPIFEHHSWEIVFPLPDFLVSTGRKAKGAVIDDLASYFDLPQVERRDVAAFVLRGEDVMRENGIGSRDIAALQFKIFWGINGMTSILAFWLLARTVYTPNLLEELRAEVAPAFENGIDTGPDMEYLKTCPKLNATFYETLRVHGGASGFRRVVSDTTIAGYNFKTGSDVIMPYRQLHIDKEICVPAAETFDINRFIDNPKLATGKTFKPFGGGPALCYGRFLVRQMAPCFLATLVTRYDMEVVGDCPFPEMDHKVPQVGVIVPIMDQIPKIRVRQVTGG